jgi:hypothetical protein
MVSSSHVERTPELSHALDAARMRADSEQTNAMSPYSARLAGASTATSTVPIVDQQLAMKVRGC